MADQQSVDAADEQLDALVQGLTYVTLHTARPPTAANEISSGGYARIERSSANGWQKQTVGSYRRLSNRGSFAFPSPSGEWSVAAGCMAVWDGVPGPTTNWLWYVDLNTAIRAGAGVTVSDDSLAYEIALDEIDLPQVSTGGLTQSQVDTRITTLRPVAFTSAENLKLAGVEDRATRDQSAAEIRDELGGLSGDDRLNATAIRNLPTEPTGATIVTALGTLQGTARLPASSVRDLPGLNQTQVDARVSHYGQPFTQAEKTKLTGVDTGAKDDQTAAEIVSSIETLSGDDRLDASAVKNLPTGGGSGPGTTYTEITQSEAQQGTSAVGRLISGRRLKTAIDALGVDIHTGAGAPSNSLGKIGDLYFRTGAPVSLLLKTAAAVWTTVIVQGADDQTGAEIKSALETLTGNNRLLSTAIQGIPTFPSLISQDDAEAGTATATALFSALRIKQAIDSLGIRFRTGTGEPPASDNRPGRDLYSRTGTTSPGLYFFTTASQWVNVLTPGSGSGSGLFTQTLLNKLNGIEASATADQTAAEIRDALATLTTNDRLDASAIKNLPTSSGGGNTGVSSISAGTGLTATSSTGAVGLSIDNPYSAAEKTKLSGIETNAKGDQTGGEIATLLGNLSGSARLSFDSLKDSGVKFTSDDHTKLDGIDTGAKDDQTAHEIRDALQTLSGTARLGIAYINGTLPYTDTLNQKLGGIFDGAEPNPAEVTKGEAEAGTEAAERSWSPVRVHEAIAALAPTNVRLNDRLVRAPANDVSAATLRGINSNIVPHGGFTDATHFWVIDDNGDAAYAFNAETGMRDSARDITRAVMRSASSGIDPEGGFAADGIGYVVDRDGDAVWAFNLTDGTRNSGRDLSRTLIRSARSGIVPSGGFTDGTTAWVIDESNRARIYAFQLSGRSRDSDKDLNVQAIISESNYALRGGWSDGKHAWLVDAHNVRVWCINLETHALNDELGISTSVIQNLTSNTSGINGGFAVGSKVWLIGGTDDELWAFERSFSITDLEGKLSRDNLIAGQNITLTPGDGNNVTITAAGGGGSSLSEVSQSIATTDTLTADVRGWSARRINQAVQARALIKHATTLTNGNDATTPGWYVWGASVPLNVPDVANGSMLVVHAGDPPTGDARVIQLVMAEANAELTVRARAQLVGGGWLAWSSNFARRLYRGEWTAATYGVGDIVHHGPEFYICRAARTAINSDNPLVDTASWQLVLRTGGQLSTALEAATGDDRLNINALRPHATTEDILAGEDTPAVFTPRQLVQAAHSHAPRNEYQIRRDHIFDVAPSTIQAAQSGATIGGCAMTDTHFYLVDRVNRRILVFDRDTGTYNDGMSFTTAQLQAARSAIDPVDCAITGTDIAVVDRAFDSVWFFNRSTKARVSGRDLSSSVIRLADANISISGITIANDVVWICDEDPAAIWAFNLTAKSRRAAADISNATLIAFGENFQPEGLDTDGSTLYIADQGGPRIFVLDIATNSRVEVDEVTTSLMELADPDITPTGVMVDDQHYYVVDDHANGLWAYVRPDQRFATDEQAAAGTRNDLSMTVRQVARQDAAAVTKASQLILVWTGSKGNPAALTPYSAKKFDVETTLPAAWESGQTNAIGSLRSHEGRAWRSIKNGDTTVAPPSLTASDPDKNVKWTLASGYRTDAQAVVLGDRSLNSRFRFSFKPAAGDPPLAESMAFSISFKFSQSFQNGFWIGMGMNDQGVEVSNNSQNTGFQFYVNLKALTGNNARGVFIEPKVPKGSQNRVSSPNSNEGEFTFYNGAGGRRDGNTGSTNPRILKLPVWAEDNGVQASDPERVLTLVHHEGTLSIFGDGILYGSWDLQSSIYPFRRHTSGNNVGSYAISPGIYYSVSTLMGNTTGPFYLTGLSVGKPNLSSQSLPSMEGIDLRRIIGSGQDEGTYNPQVVVDAQGGAHIDLGTAV